MRMTRRRFSACGMSWRSLLLFAAVGTLVPSAAFAQSATADAGPTLSESEVAALFPPELTQFQAYKKNPVFEASGAGAWDVKIRERGWILKDDDGWRFWFTGYDGTRQANRAVGLATSDDGLTWTRASESPIFDERWTEDMTVLKRDGRYWMFAEEAHQTQRLVSDDGVSWTSLGTLSISNADKTPIEPGPFGTPVVLIKDGRWQLLYERGDRGVWLATSDDGQNFVNVQDDPVLTRGQAGCDTEMIALNQVLEHDGRWYGLYHGSPDEAAPRRWCSCLAVSDDLIRWTKYPHNPLLPLIENKSSPMLVPVEGGFRLYTTHDRVDVHFGKGVSK